MSQGFALLANSQKVRCKVCKFGFSLMLQFPLTVHRHAGQADQWFLTFLAFDPLKRRNTCLRFLVKGYAYGTGFLKDFYGCELVKVYQTKKRKQHKHNFVLQKCFFFPFLIHLVIV